MSYGNIFSFSLIDKYTLEVTIISVVNFLITCLPVSEMLKDKDTSHLRSWIFKKSMTSRAMKHIFL